MAYIPSIVLARLAGRRGVTSLLVSWLVHLWANDLVQISHPSTYGPMMVPGRVLDRKTTYALSNGGIYITTAANSPSNSSLAGWLDPPYKTCFTRSSPLAFHDLRGGNRKPFWLGGWGRQAEPWRGQGRTGLDWANVGETQRSGTETMISEHKAQTAEKAKAIE